MKPFPFILILFGFFFIGLLNRGFAASCDYTSCDYNEYSIASLKEFDCEDDLISAWQSLGLSHSLGEPTVFSGNSWVNGCMGVPDGTSVWFGYQDDAYSRTFYVLCPDNCCAASQAAVGICISQSNIIWDGGCNYHCKCPDYTGQPDYNFDTCAVDTNADPCADQAVAECGSLEKTVWDNVSTCSYHCDQGNCETEYLAKRQECDRPTLLDRLTCSYTCDCQDQIPQAVQDCPYGYYIDYSSCAHTCKCCEDLITECIEYCGALNVKDGSGCTDTTSTEFSGCLVSQYTCECIVPPVEDALYDPDPDPDYTGDGKNPDPSDDPDYTLRTCFEWQELCSSGCQFTCATDFDTGFAKYHNCDCNDDPADPSTPTDPGSADDGANGWLKQIEESADKTASSLAETNGWLKAIKHNTDEVLEDTDNIAENVRRGLENDKIYFADPDGTPYLKTITEKMGTFADNVIETSGSADIPEENEYNTEFAEADGFTPIPENKFSQELADFISSGIPLFSFVRNSSLNLSNATSVLSFTIKGYTYTVDFSRYVAALNAAGDFLFYLSLLSAFLLIISRSK